MHFTPNIDDILHCQCGHRFKTDIALMQQLGLKHLCLSLSWSRLLPEGRKGSAVSPEAVKFYSSVLDELAAAGMAHKHCWQDGVLQVQIHC